MIVKRQQERLSYIGTLWCNCASVNKLYMLWNIILAK